MQFQIRSTLRTRRSSVCARAHMRACVRACVRKWQRNGGTLAQRVHNNFYVNYNVYVKLAEAWRHTG